MNNLLNKIIKGIAKGDNDELISIVVEGLKHTNVDTKLLSNQCATTKLMLGSNLYAMAERLEKKGSQMGSESKSNRNPERDKAIKKYLTSNPLTALFSKTSRTTQQVDGLVKYLQDDACTIESKDSLIAILQDDLVKNTMIAGNMSLLAPVYLHLIQMKLNASPEDTSEMLEIEKKFEPLIISLIDIKASPLTMKSSSLRDEVRMLAKALDESNNVEESKRGKSVDAFLHDANVNSQVALISNQQEQWHTGIGRGSEKPMRYVAENGETYRLFHTDAEKTQFLKDETLLTSLARAIDSDDKKYNSNLFTLIRRIQGNPTEDGELNTRFADPAKLAQTYIKTLLLASVVKECRLSDEAIFAICDPLVEILKGMKTDRINEILEDAKKDIKTLCEEESYALSPEAETLLKPNAKVSKSSSVKSGIPAALSSAAASANANEKETVKQTQKLIIESIIGTIETRLGLKESITDKKRKELKLNDSIFSKIKDFNLKDLKKLARSEKERAVIAQDIIDELGLKADMFVTAKTTSKSFKTETSYDIMVDAIKLELNETNPRPNVTKMIDDKIKLLNLDLDALAKDEEAFTIAAKSIAEEISEELKNAETKPVKATDDKKPIKKGKNAEKSTETETLKKDYDNNEVELLPEGLVFDGKADDDENDQN